MRKLAATALLCGVALITAIPANADTTKCSGPYPMGGPRGGTYTRCTTYTDDGGMSTTTTYCDNDGNCSTGH